MTTSTIEKPTSKICSVTPFGIEAASPRNCDLQLVSLDLRLRSAISPVKQVFVKDPETGEQITIPAPAKMIPGLPGTIPGMQLHVDPSKGNWKMIDPLHGDESLCEKIKRAIDAVTETKTASKIKGISPKGGKLGRDEMKTLVREMRWLLDSGDARVATGSAPDMEDVDELPGDYLSNPGGLIQLHQPRYEKDMAGWVQSLNRVGG